MKHLIFYRRGCNNSGMKERVCWRLSKGPATGSELAEMLGMDLPAFNRYARSALLSGSATAVISASEWVKLEGRRLDRTYTLESIGSNRVKPKAGKSILVSKRTLSHLHPGMKEKNIEAAKRRARLIRAGIYIDALG